MTATDAPYRDHPALALVLEATDKKLPIAGRRAEPETGFDNDTWARLCDWCWTPHMRPDAYTTIEAAARLGITNWNFYRRWERGQIDIEPIDRNARRLLWPRHAVDAIAEQMREDDAA